MQRREISTILCKIRSLQFQTIKCFSKKTFLWLFITNEFIHFDITINFNLN